MYNAGKVIIGIGVFFLFFTSPIWYNLATGKASSAPKPVIVTGGKCIESTEFMKANHMTLLNEWRNSVVRDGNRIYVASDGKRYEMSLTRTCLRCHPNKSRFCDVCHNYEAVTPVCWECHVVPEESER